MSRTAAPGRPPRQTPYRRSYASGRTVWIARFRDLDGKMRYAKPRWNGGKSSFALKGDAQRAIDEALDRLRSGVAMPERVGEYFKRWLQHHPRSARTDKTNADRVSYVIDGRALRDWEFDELRRRQALVLLDHMLRVEGRAAEGARGIVSVLSAMAEDAIGDEAATQNAFIGIRLRRSDPRIRKPPRKIRIWSFEQMRAFAAGGRPEVRAATPRPRDARTKNRYKQKAHFYPPDDYEAYSSPRASPAFASASSSHLSAVATTATPSASSSPPMKASWSARAGRRTTSAPFRCHRPWPS
jgi:hypothetical protein